MEQQRAWLAAVCYQCVGVVSEILECDYFFSQTTFSTFISISTERLTMTIPFDLGSNLPRGVDRLPPKLPHRHLKTCNAAVPDLAFSFLAHPVCPPVPVCTVWPGSPNGVRLVYTLHNTLLGRIRSVIFNALLTWHGDAAWPAMTSGSLQTAQLVKYNMPKVALLVCYCPNWCIKQFPLSLLKQPC